MIGFSYQFQYHYLIPTCVTYLFCPRKEDKKQPGGEIVQNVSLGSRLRPEKKNIVCLPSSGKIKILGWSVDFLFFFYFLIFFTLSNFSGMINGQLTKDFIANTKQCRA